MKRLVLPAMLLAALSLPAGASAAGVQRATVLSVDRAAHTVQLVDAHRAVHAYRYTGGARLLRTGSVIAFRRRGATIAGVHAAGRARSVSFYASVVRSSGPRLVLGLADGQSISVRARSVHALIAHAADAGGPAVAVPVAGLQPGATVLVTETVASDGSVAITVAPPTTAIAPSSAIARIAGRFAATSF